MLKSSRSTTEEQNQKVDDFIDLILLYAFLAFYQLSIHQAKWAIDLLNRNFTIGEAIGFPKHYTMVQRSHTQSFFRFYGFKIPRGYKFDLALYSHIYIELNEIIGSFENPPRETLIQRTLYEFYSKFLRDK